ncbi:indole-3-glycerol phosphate synthase TrpC, partial [bacterium]|nr:indole-3-glycerol phosphate synthase TrpC [bacterium]
MNILNEIIENKKKEVEQRKEKISIEDIERSLEDIYDLPQRSFLEAIRKIDNINIIAEIKKASPSKGVINQDVDIVEIAKIYENSGVSAISVLTDYKYFKGSLDYLTEVSQAVNIPCLCKDFIIDPYQVYEAKLYLADAFLIIAKALDAEKIRALVDIGRDLRLDALVEVHDLEDIKK